MYVSKPAVIPNRFSGEGPAFFFPHNKGNATPNYN